MTTHEEELEEIVEDMIFHENGLKVENGEVVCEYCGSDEFVEPNDLFVKIHLIEEDGEIYPEVRTSEEWHYTPSVICANCRNRSRNKYDLLDEIELLIKELKSSGIYDEKYLIEALIDLVNIYDDR